MKLTKRLNVGVTTFTALAALGANLATGQPALNNTNSYSTTPPGQAPGSEATTRELKVTGKEMKRNVTDINKASKLIGMRVRSPQNENLGKIEDLVIDHESGKVAYAVLSSGGLLGIGDKLVAIPFEALSLQPGADRLVLNMDKQRLEQAPGFTQNNWPNLDILEQGQTVGLAHSQDPAQRGAAEDQREGRRQTRGTLDSLDQTQNVVTDANQLMQASTASQWDGKQVRLDGLIVREIIENKVVVAAPQSASNNQALYILSRDPVSSIKQGQAINVRGTVHRVPSQAETLGVDRSTAQRLQSHPLYIDANHVSVNE